eukprot:TRINITY_DN1236_c0_g1_i1.p1 TRINITY_DN1236_c0_g1~~TRINITY_DN1236_c0_g1_i1.p1  ORF type:complete len:118 (-),score=16.60 TRINITY_DN1236_c0_g1_i1:46-399(-)
MCIRDRSTQSTGRGCFSWNLQHNQPDTMSHTLSAHSHPSFDDEEDEEEITLLEWVIESIADKCKNKNARKQLFGVVWKCALFGGSIYAFSQFKSKNWMIVPPQIPALLQKEIDRQMM